VKVTVSLSGVLRAVRNLGSLAAIVVALANVGGLPASVRTALLAVGGGVQWIEHYISPQPTTSANPTTPPPTARPSGG